MACRSVQQGASTSRFDAFSLRIRVIRTTAEIIQKKSVFVSCLDARRCITLCEGDIPSPNFVAPPGARRLRRLAWCCVPAMTFFSHLPAEERGPKLVGFLGFDGVTTLDLTGPLEAFAAARTDAEGSEQACYETVLLGVTSKTFVAGSGAMFKAQHTIRTAPDSGYHHRPWRLTASKFRD